jgi:kynureninase
MIGAKHDHEVCCMGELCVDIHLLLAAFYKPEGKTRNKVLMEEGAFPSDRVHYR